MRPLDMADDPETMRVGRRAVEVSRRDKVFDADAGITKGDVLDYLARVAEHALPHWRERFLTLRRCPDGLDEDGFWQQQRPGSLPDWMPATRAARADGSEIVHLSVDDAAGMVALGDLGTLEFHGWCSRRDAPKRPDVLVFDLDPPGEDFAPVRAAARRVGDLLDELGTTPFVKTTGSRGLHVVVPLDAEAGFDEARECARDAARLLAERHSEELTVEQRKAKRDGRLYLDVMRNAYGQTRVLPYSPRARPGLPVATPIAWEELDDADLRADRWTIGNLFRRLGQREDPWSGFRRHGKSVKALREALERLQR